MNATWNNISTGQRQQFLSQAGLASLPELSALDAAQWNMLTGIVGETAAKELRQTAGAAGTIAAPALDLPKETGDWSNIMMKVAEIRMKLSELQQKTSVEDIKAQKDKMTEANKLEAEKIKESLDKLGKAATSGVVGKIFGWIGAGIAIAGALVLVAAAVAASIASGGVATPLVVAATVALTMAVAGMAMMILQETGGMEAIMNFVVDNPVMFSALTGFGLVDLDKDQVKMLLQISISVSMMVVSIGAAVFSAVFSGGSTAGIAALQIVGAVGQIVGALASIGSGAAGIAQSAYSHQAAEVQADVQENKAWLAKLQQMLSEEMDRLQEILNRLNGDVADASDLLGDIAGSNRAVIANMGM